MRPTRSRTRRSARDGVDDGGGDGLCCCLSRASCLNGDRLAFGNGAFRLCRRHRRHDVLRRRMDSVLGHRRNPLAHKRHRIGDRPLRRPPPLHRPPGNRLKLLQYHDALAGEGDGGCCWCCCGVAVMTSDDGHCFVAVALLMRSYYCWPTGRSVRYLKMNYFDYYFGCYLVWCLMRARHPVGHYD